jgi:hypothetical protein
MRQRSRCDKPCKEALSNVRAAAPQVDKGACVRSSGPWWLRAGGTAVTLALLATLWLEPPAAAQIVETPIAEDPIAIDSGTVSGKLLPSGVKAYFGIPYAAAPVADLR